jgi:hypothetical protein
MLNYNNFVLKISNVYYAMFDLVLLLQKLIDGYFNQLGLLTIFSLVVFL